MFVSAIFKLNVNDVKPVWKCAISYQTIHNYWRWPSYGTVFSQAVTLKEFWETVEMKIAYFYILMSVSTLHLNCTKFHQIENTSGNSNWKLPFYLREKNNKFLIKLTKCCQKCLRTEKPQPTKNFCSFFRPSDALQFNPDLQMKPSKFSNSIPAKIRIQVWSFSLWNLVLFEWKLNFIRKFCLWWDKLLMRGNVRFFKKYFESLEH